MVRTDRIKNIRSHLNLTEPQRTVCQGQLWCKKLWLQLHQPTPVDESLGLTHGLQERGGDAKRLDMIGTLTHRVLQTQKGIAKIPLLQRLFRQSHSSVGLPIPVRRITKKTNNRYKTGQRHRPSNPENNTSSPCSTHPFFPHSAILLSS
jgi:hypothetical protein